MVENHLTDEAMTRSFGGPAFGPAHRLVETDVGLVDSTVVIWTFSRFNKKQLRNGKEMTENEQKNIFHDR